MLFELDIQYDVTTPLKEEVLPFPRKIISLGYSVTEGTRDRCQDDGRVGNGYRFLRVSDGLVEIGYQIFYGLSSNLVNGNQL